MIAFCYVFYFVGQSLDSYSLLSRLTNTFYDYLTACLHIGTQPYKQQHTSICKINLISILSAQELNYCE